MRRKLTKKEEQFALGIFEGLTHREAWKRAGYSTRYPIAHIDRDASLIANKPKILQRIEELRKRAEDASVMNVLERKQKLSIIARADLTEFQTAGADGSWVDIGPENPSSGALQEITSRTEYDNNGAGAAVITKIKLHDPLKAIDLLNKMDKLYSDGAQINIDNRKVEAHFVNIDPKTIAAAILEAERLGLTPELLGGNGHGEDASILSSPTNIQATSVPEPED